MTGVVLTIVTVAAVGWLAFLAVSSLRARGKEEVAPNLSAGRTDDELETKRLERVLVGAGFAAAFLAIGLPLYYLGEQDRQESFVEQFDEESAKRGEHIVTEFACYSCHGPGGAGGSAPFVEKRSGIRVLWTAPSLNDIFYRYEKDEVIFWITYGRGNSPMPAWGLPGGGPLSEKQVVDVATYIESIQIPQDQALAKLEPAITEQLTRFEAAQASVETAVLEQRQVIANLAAAPGLAPVAKDLARQARAALKAAATGIDTDGDALSDAAETSITALLGQAQEALTTPGLLVITLDPALAETDLGSPDAERAAAAVAAMEALVERAPILTSFAAAARVALDDASAGADGDQDGLSDQAEGVITTQIGLALAKLRPPGLTVANLDPTNVNSVPGTSDSRTASRAVSSLETVATNLEVAATNQDELGTAAAAGLAFLLEAQSARKWDVDLQVVADSVFDGDLERAARASALFNANCARCHTSGFSAGAAYTQPAGSGGFAPALWEGRPNVQFLTQADLVAFLIKGSEAQRPYGVNGFGSGRMPAFGKILPSEDIELIATYLRSGNLTGD